MIGKEQIEKCNIMLRDLDAIFPLSDGVHQKFQWKWSSDLFEYVPVYGDDGEVKFEYVCSCGKGVNIHTPQCKGIIRAVTMMQRLYLVDPDGPCASYPNMWMLCRWKPPVLLADWVEQMGTERDYPATGTYIPVTRGPLCVAIPPKAVPADYIPVTHKVMEMMREQVSRLEELSAAKEIIREVPKFDGKGNMVEEPDKKAKFWDIRDRIKDSMRKWNPASTSGYGGKSADFKVTYSDRSLADSGSPLMRQRAEQKREQAEELRKELAKEDVKRMVPPEVHTAVTELLKQERG